ncbi:MAG: hypothetical protein WCW13_02905 [archaeon]|jgi:hypothetical protein
MVEKILQRFAHWTINDKMSNRLDSDCDGVPYTKPPGNNPWPE